MASIILTSENVRVVKKELRYEFPDIKSSHLTEAFATSLHFRTHAALQSQLRSDNDTEPEIVLIDENRFFQRLSELGYQTSETDIGTFELLALYDETQSALIPTMHHSSWDIEYKSSRSRAWRNIMVAGVNAGIERKLFSVRPGDNRWPDSDRDGVTFSVVFGDGIPGLVWIRGSSHYELTVHVALWPTSDSHRWLNCWNAGFAVGEVFARGWVERDRGAYLQSSPKLFCCRRHRLKQLAELDITPKGFGDRGPVH